MPLILRGRAASAVRIGAGRAGRSRRSQGARPPHRAAHVDRQRGHQDPGPDLYRSPFLLLVSFGRHLSPERRAELVAGGRDAHARQLAEYEALRAAGPGDAFDVATLDFGIAYERAVLEWFDALPPELSGEQPRTWQPRM